MKIDLKALDNGQTEFGFLSAHLDFSPDPLTPVLLEPVMTTVKLFRKGSQIIIRGQSRAQLNIPCSRCLEMGKHLIIAEFNWDFRPKTRHDYSESNLELCSEELDVIWYTGDELDLEDQVRQNIIINLPMQPLCMENCKGLCSQCGTNLNKKICSCNNSHNSNPLKELSKYRLS